MKPSRAAAPVVVAVSLILVPLVYVGSYAALVDVPGKLAMGDDGTCFVHHFRWGGKAAEVVFWPLRQVDRFMRPTQHGS
jgi:hypothetical protein